MIFNFSVRLVIVAVSFAALICPFYTIALSPMRPCAPHAVVGVEERLARDEGEPAEADPMLQRS